MEHSEYMVILVRLIACTLVWFTLHQIFYCILPIPAKIRAENESKTQKDKFYHYVSYFPGLLHGSITTFLSVCALLESGIDFGGPACMFSKTAAYYSASYFIHDGLLGYFRKYNDALIQTHHVLMTGCLVWALTHGGYGSDIALGLALGEVTNPIISTHDVLNYLGVAETYTRPLGVLFLVSFIGIRGLVMPYPMYLMQMGKADFLFKIAYTGMWVISMMLIWMMINKCAKLLHSAYPTNIMANNFYKKMREVRPYYPAYLCLSTFLATGGLIKHYYLGGNAIRWY